MEYKAPILFISPDDEKKLRKLTEEEIKKLKELKDKTIKDHKIILK